MSISNTDAGRAHLVQLLAVAGDGVGEIDDVEDLGAAEAGDLHGSHAGEAGLPPPGRDRGAGPRPEPDGLAGRTDAPARACGRGIRTGDAYRRS